MGGGEVKGEETGMRQKDEERRRGEKESFQITASIISLYL